MSLSTDALLKQAEQKKKELREKRENSNPDGRLAGYTIINMYIALTGKHPFEFEKRDGRMQQKRIKQGLCEREFKESRMFSAKLHTNRKEIEDNISVLRSLLPSLSKEESGRIKDYEEKKIDLKKINAGVEDLDQFGEKELTALMGSNKEIYENSLAELEKEYKDVLQRMDDVLEECDHILKQPLLKCEFDFLTEDDVASAGISEEDMREIDPMIKF